MRHRFTHIKGLAFVQTAQNPHGFVSGADQGNISIVENAYLDIDKGLIAGFGAMNSPEALDLSGIDTVENVEGRWILPGFVDSHTHTVFAAWRESEFDMRLKGVSYQEIAAAGGGILNSALALSFRDEARLCDDALQRLHSMRKTGTTAVEIKSGYGLSLETERKMLRVIAELKRQAPQTIKATFLGLHALPASFHGNIQGYVKEVVEQWLPALADEGLIDFVDIFTETGYFSVQHQDILLEAAHLLGIPSKVHVNQFSSLGGVSHAVSKNAYSVDHLEVMTENDFEALAASLVKDRPTLATALPGCSHFLKIPYAPGRTLIDRGIPLALASDFNPGSSPCSNLFTVWNLACVHMGLTPKEALAALTLNGAYSIGLESSMGSIAVGKRAHFIVTEPSNSLAFFPYRYGENHAAKVYIDGVS